MITRKQLMENKKLLKDKVAGALIGLAVGDSLGDAARTKNNNYNYGFTTDFTGEKTWSTDDTEFALLTALMLLESKGNLTSDVVLDGWKKHVVSLDELNRGGASEREAANNIRNGIDPPDSGKHNTNHMSDGAAMRIAPIGIFCAGDVDRAGNMAEVDAQISHWRDGIWGAQAVAAAVSVAMVNGSTDEILNAVVDYVPEGSFFRHKLDRAFDLANSNSNIHDIWMTLHDVLWTEVHSTTPEAVTAAFSILKMTQCDFNSSFFYGCNYGRDADTIGAVIGSVCGAIHGLNAFPNHWVEKVRYPTGTCLGVTNGMDILDVADQLTDLILSE